MSSFAGAAPGPTVYYFFASWHDSHTQMSAVFAALPSLAASCSLPVAFHEVEAETSPSLTEKHAVTVVPTFVLLRKDGSLHACIESPDPALLSAQLLALIAEPEAAPAQPPAKGPAEPAPAEAKAAAAAPEGAPEGLSDETEAQIKSLLAASPVLLFMKGSPSLPKCGFSRQIVELLQGSGVTFSSFDILNPEQQEVRAGLKVFSDWPTFPQL